MWKQYQFHAITVTRRLVQEGLLFVTKANTTNSVLVQQDNRITLPNFRILFNNYNQKAIWLQGNLVLEIFILTFLK